MIDQPTRVTESAFCSVVIDLCRVRASAERIKARTGVSLIAVVKADAYGLGAGPVADALESVADEFAYFSLDEARAVGRPGLVLGPYFGEYAEYRELNLRPTVTNHTEAQQTNGIPAAINLDTGMQRLGCTADQLDDLVARCNALEVLTHADRVDAAKVLRASAGHLGLRMHAAATSLLETPEAWLDAVRPGLALYQGAVRVTIPLHAVRKTTGRVGYTGFECKNVGVILVGYRNLMRPATVSINGRNQRILEVGMNTSFVSINPADKAGDEVVLLGDDVTESQLSSELGVRPHEILCRYTAMGARTYLR